MAQVAREKALTKFREDKIRVLVATDVAARGIDVAGVSHVINYTCPEDDKTYVHRIGRTGRAGATGIAITFVDWADLHRWKMINKALDLPFDEPQETYSTSEHLFHDQGIPPGTKGRIVAAAPQRRATAARDRPRERAAAATASAPAAHRSRGRSAAERAAGSQAEGAGAGRRRPGRSATGAGEAAAPSRNRAPSASLAGGQPAAAAPPAAALVRARLSQATVHRTLQRLDAP